MTGERLCAGSILRVVEPSVSGGVVYAMSPVGLWKHVLFTGSTRSPFTRRELEAPELARLAALLEEPSRTLLALTLRHGPAIRASVEAWRASGELLEMDCGERWAAMLDADEQGVFGDAAWVRYVDAFRVLREQSADSAADLHAVHTQQLERRAPLLDARTLSTLRRRMEEVRATLPPKRRRTDGSSMIGLEKLVLEWMLRLRA